MCNGCGVKWSSLTAKIQNDASASIVDEGRRATGLIHSRVKSANIILEKISKHFTSRKLKILDVGCGQGVFLDRAIKAGHVVTGVEPDGNAFCKLKSAHLDKHCVHGFFPDVLNENQCFDVIVFNDVLEHVPDAPRTISAAYKHLKPGGLLVINSPNKRGLFFKQLSF